MFHVGQKVVCIKRIPWRDEETRQFVWIGPLYKEECTVAEIVPLPTGLHLCLAEYSADECWIATAFRPVTERKTDIEIFRRLLVPGAKIVETV